MDMADAISIHRISYMHMGLYTYIADPISIILWDLLYIYLLVVA